MRQRAAPTFSISCLRPSSSFIISVAMDSRLRNAAVSSHFRPNAHLQEGEGGSTSASTNTQTGVTAYAPAVRIRHLPCLRLAAAGVLYLALLPHVVVHSDNSVGLCALHFSFVPMHCPHATFARRAMSSFKAAIQLINQIAADKFPLLLTRIIQKLHLKVISPSWHLSCVFTDS